MKCLAIDMGASSIRIVLGIISDGHIEYQEIYRCKNEMQFIDDTFRWDMKSIFFNIVDGINKAFQSHADIVSVGVDSWGVDYVLLDQSGEMIEIPFAYRDARTDNMMETWKQLMSERETFNRTGINFYSFNTLLQLLSEKDSPKLKQVSSLLFIPSYINYKLTRLKSNETTIASTSQLLEVDSNQFDRTILEKLGINPNIVESTIEAGTTIGKINHPQIESKQCKLISVPGHDTACAVAAIPATDKQFVFIATGTWCIVGTESRNPILSTEAMDLGFTNERGYENTYRILKNIVGLWLIQGIRKALPIEYTFLQLEKMALNADYSGHIIDPEDAIFHNPENMIHAFDEYFINTGQSKPKDIGEYVKCAYNSLCHAFAYYIQKLEELSKQSFRSIHVIGGGSQSEYLCQNTANISAKTVYSGPVESAVLGNIMAQAIAHNKIKNMQEGREIIRKSFPPKVFSPSKQNVDYDEMHQKFIELKNIKYVKQ